MSETVYDLSKYPRHQPLNKPYWVIYPDSKEVDHDLSRIFNVQKHVSAMFEEVRAKSVGKAFLRVAKATPVGHTPQEECIILVVQGVVAKVETKPNSMADGS
jgi:hypothetical protein